jgi:hypothetical protein
MYHVPIYVYIASSRHEGSRHEGFEDAVQPGIVFQMGRARLSARGVTTRLGKYRTIA